MRNAFRAYLPLSDAEHKQLWQDALFVVDANVLLQLYRYSAETRAEMLRLLGLIRDRLWLPHQAGLEFHRNRLGVISDQRATYDKLAKGMDEIMAALTQPRRHPFVSADLLARMDKLFGEVRTELEKPQNEFDGQLKDDELLGQIVELFDGRIGEPLDSAEWASIQKEADERIANKVPPGFLDAQKAGDGKYGDFLVWTQTLRKAEAEKQPVILVTNDEKDDWWQTHHGRTIGPRVELREEFFGRTGQLFHMYTTDRFMSFANQFQQARIADEAIEEAEQSKHSAVPDEVISQQNLTRLFNDAFARHTENQRAVSSYVSTLSAEQLEKLSAGLVSPYSEGRVADLSESARKAIEQLSAANVTFRLAGTNVPPAAIAKVPGLSATSLPKESEDLANGGVGSRIQDDADSSPAMGGED